MNDYLEITIVVTVSLILNGIIRNLINKKYEKAGIKKTMTPAVKRRLKNFTSVVIFTFLIAYTLTLFPHFKNLGKTIFTGAGIAGIIIGLSAQEALSNMIGGVFITIFKPFRIGDIITLSNGQFGTIESLTLRHTVLVNVENQRVIIPNSIMSKEIIINHNIEDLKSCKMIKIDISYDSDIDLALQIMIDECENHPLCIDTRTDEEKEAGYPQIVTRVLGLGDSSVKLRASAWTTNPVKGFQMASDLNRSIKLRFDEEGVEIPFPHRTIVYKKDLQANSNTKSD